MIEVPVLWLVLLLIFAVVVGFIAGWLLGADVVRREIEAEWAASGALDASHERAIKLAREAMAP
ncbi:hypothetical protein FRZ44_38290 [Hypericibacter terrae]|uniref:Uncharacterized protein n=1 Tax=Hypericibacter terrae TaxID=2602015 RepID=A0A5J6MLP2_9PROT|nr:hypothetical protein [Hypericibacter terrae]QEX18522.1 hypothetical protein FRZ44_38290 [Hypericibacter terrae]